MTNSMHNNVIFRVDKIGSTSDCNCMSVCTGESYCLFDIICFLSGVNDCIGVAFGVGCLSVIR